MDQNGNVQVAVTQPILGSTEGDNGQRISTFTGANITVNTNSDSPFFGSWPAGGLFGPLAAAYTAATLNAATILHELGHAANFAFGPGSSAIADDGHDLPSGNAISSLNTNIVLINCFGAR